MLPAILMEFEGVLACTANARRDALCAALAVDGVEFSGAAFDEHCAGLGVRDAVAAAVRAAGAPLDAVAVDLATLRAERGFAERFGKGTLLAAGAREFVERAHGAAPLALVTRASRREVDFALRLSGLLPAFECVVTADDVRAPKPDPAGHAVALERLARKRAPTAPRRDAIALEDAAPGIAAAHAAGLRCVAVGAVPAYLAVAADAYVLSLDAHTPQSIARLAATHGEDRVTHEQH